MKHKRNLIMAPVLAGCLAVQGCAAKPIKDPSAEMNTEASDHVSNGADVRPSKGNIRLEDDYYGAINQKLLDGVSIPEDSNNWGYFYVLGNEAYERLDSVLKKTVKNRKSYDNGSVEQKVADLYLSAMDLAGRDEAGLGELKGYVDHIRQSYDIPGYLDALWTLMKDLGLGSLITVDYDVDMGDSSRYACYIGAGDLGLGKETLEDESQEKLHNEYQRYIAAMLVKAGVEDSDSEQAAKEVFDFMKDMASSALPLSDAGDPSKIYHPYTTEDLKNLAPHMDLKAVIDGIGAGDRSSFIVMEPEYMMKLGSYLTKDHLEMLKNYSSFCLMNDFGIYLSTDIRDEVLRFRQFRDGSARIRSNEKLASQMTQSLLGFEFGKLYVDHYFSQESKQKVEQMVHQILDSYEDKIDALDWMGRETKEAAKRKLETMDLKIGYPDMWPNVYEHVRIVSPENGGALIHNVLNLVKAATAHKREKSKGPVNRTEWLMTPQTVNAYYNPLLNEIVFPAAILQAPFYDPLADPAENLGGIGMVIAHEITHAFDDSGSQYDENGNYHVWWTEADYENFTSRTRAVAEYYDGYEGFNGIHVNGTQTLGENIADLGAVSCVMRIVGNDPSKLQKLCAGYARIWASKYTDESMRMRLSTDVHAPARVRVNAVLSSMEGFYLAYPDISEGDGMYVPPEQRVNVW